MEFDLVYNSQTDKLIISEYGRNVQNMIEHVKTVEDKEERQAYAEAVVNLMHLMNPQNKNVKEYRLRLWKHFFVIGGFDMDVTPPAELDLLAIKEPTKPDKVEYPTKQKKFRHYGHNISTLIAKAREMEDGPIKEGFVETIASFMKLAYKNWNREHYVSDEIVLADLATMSDGELTVPDNTSLDSLAKAIVYKRKPFPSNNRKKNNNNRNNNRNRNNKRRGKHR